MKLNYEEHTTASGGVISLIIVTLMETSGPYLLSHLLVLLGTLLHRGSRRHGLSGEPSGPTQAISSSASAIRFLLTRDHSFKISLTELLGAIRFLTHPSVGEKSRRSSERSSRMLRTAVNSSSAMLFNEVYSGSVCQDTF
jgi:hypothetical protein